jgi:hypothetical protein
LVAADVPDQGEIPMSRARIPTFSAGNVDTAKGPC